ncbi:MAG: CRTAC1 family protein [Planctomycetota bacterium]
MLRNVASARGGGREYVDATERFGGADTGAGMGALFFDADGDRDLDLYVANYGADVLYEERLGATKDGETLLHDVSAAAGVGGDLWSAGICAGDADNDGDLDLYVTSYLEYDEENMPPMEDLPYRREDPVAMLPYAFRGQRNTYLRNESTAEGLRFVDATEEAGVADETGLSMQAVFIDFDRDGDLDLYVANDVSPNVLYRGNGDGTFRDVSFQTGMDDPRGGMGVALGDVDLDGDEDLFLTNWQLESNALYTANLVARRSQKHRVATFRDSVVESGLAPYGVGVTSWGAVFGDLDCDGDLDLYVANGYTSPDYESTGICVAQPDHLFLGDGTGRFEASFASIPAARDVGPPDLSSRCVLACDYDRDGDEDLFVTANNGPYRLLRNDAERKGRFLGVRLACAAPNTHGIGARVEVRTERRTFTRTLLAGTSYLGGNPPELHFGLGACEKVLGVTVHLPSGGATLEFGEQPLDAWVTLDTTAGTSARAK